MCSLCNKITLEIFKIAIKIIDTRKVTHEYKCKFLPREVHTWKHLRHPNLVALFDAFEQAGKVYLTMELAENGDLVRVNISIITLKQTVLKQNKKNGHSKMCLYQLSKQNTVM